MPDSIPAGPLAPITAADIKDEIWLEIARHRTGAAPPRQALQVQPEPPPQGPLPLGSLLALDGAAFVDAAYRTVLGRAADHAGAAYFMREMAAGRSKVVLLGQLQRSGEGRAAQRAVPGLRRRYTAHRLYRVPVLGGLARVAGSALRRSGVSKAIAGQQPAPPSLAEQAASLERLGAAQEAAERRAGEQATSIEAATLRIAAQEEAIRAGVQPTALEAALKRLAAQEEANQRTLATIASQGRAMSGLVTQGLSIGRRLGGVEDSSLEAMLSMADSLAEQAARLGRIEGLLDGEAVAAQIDAGAAALRRSLDERLSRAEATVARNRQDVIDQERRIGLMLEALRSRPGALPDALQAEDDRAMAGLYVDFEDRFRGTRADIKQRQRFYLPAIEEARASTSARPVVDIGCGRGEFLELLRDEGFAARGVDMNAAMVAGCQARGLDCVAEDALAYLGRQEAGSLGAVTGFHVIEHLPFRTMVRLFDAALHALAPGGVIVFETPNPANLLMASRWFYLDPTHRNPLPSEMVAMIAEARGFCRISVVELHPMDVRFGGDDPVLRGELDALFHGPQDYAVLARKP